MFSPTICRNAIASSSKSMIRSRPGEPSRLVHRTLRNISSVDGASRSIRIRLDVSTRYQRQAFSTSAARRDKSDSKIHDRRPLNVNTGGASQSGGDTGADGGTRPPRRSSWQIYLDSLSPIQRRWVRLLGYCTLLSAIIHVPIVIYLLNSDTEDIAPYEHSPRIISKMIRLTPRHKYLEVSLGSEPAKLFGPSAKGMDGESIDTRDGTVAVQHVLIKSPAIQVERSYTPINDVEKDGMMKLVVKRVRGGEVGRVVFAQKEGDRLWIRGPVTTFAINPYDFDRIVMVSTGTGIAPFLQFLSKLPSPRSPDPAATLTPAPQTPSSSSLVPAPAPSSPIPGSSTTPASESETLTMATTGTSVLTLPQLQLIHSLPSTDNPESDWPESMGIFSNLRQKFGDNLRIDRVPAGEVPRGPMATALGVTKSTRAGGGGGGGSWLLPWNWGRANTSSTSTSMSSSNLEAGNDKDKDRERVMVLVSLPPHLMDPLCGRMTSDFQQGELTGLLREMGLHRQEVWKLD